MPEVPHDRAQILPTAAGRARVVAAELDRLRSDLAKSRSADLTDAAREDGLALLVAARDALQALHESMSASDLPAPPEVRKSAT